MDFDLIRLIIGIVFLSYASVQDLKTRCVNDKVWLALGSIGLILLIFTTPYYPTFIFIAVMFFSFFLELADKTNLKELKVRRVYWLFVWCIALSILAYLVYKHCILTCDMTFLSILTIPVLQIFIYILYSSRLLYGGADAKALICITLLTPFYPLLTKPLLAYFSIKLLWPYPLVILTNGIIITSILPLCFLVYNLIRRDFKFPLSFLGYKLAIEEAEHKFVWPLEVARNGKIVKIYFPKRTEDTTKELEALRRLGAKELWGTPKIPFIIPLLGGFVTSYFIGDIMYNIVKALVRF
ncbi:MAG: A24 family peptidase C-terminal domain-containing protein [Candidatus Thermoplasmatota archaeon]|nr:A24 family peptidase C-terminal domain-containing protein [Candidatus Thermoplasmatota archaeon]